MSFSGLATTQTISYTNLQDAVTNGYFTLVSAITSTQQESTKSYVAAHVSGYSTDYPPYVLKASNQLVVKGDIYNPGNYILDPNYGMRFTSMSGSVGGLPTFSFPVTAGNTTLTYNGTIAAQTISVGLAGTLVTSPAKIILYVDNVQIDCQSIVTGTQTKNLVLSVAVKSPSTLKISINTGTCATPTVSFSSMPIASVAVSKNTGQYQIVAQGTKQVSSKGYPTSTQGYLYTSTNYGATWTQRTQYAYWNKVALSGDGAYMLAVSSTGLAYKSANSLSSITAISSITERVTGAALSGNGLFQTIVAYQDNSNNVVIYRSTDSGANFTKLTTGISAITRKMLFSVCMDTTGQYQVVCSIPDLITGVYAGGVYYSSDYGATWSLSTYSSAAGTLNCFYNVSSSPDGTKMIATCNAGNGVSYLYTSTDFGANWSKVLDDFNNIYINSTVNNTTTSYVTQSGNNYIRKITSLSSKSDITTAPTENIWQSIDMDNSGTYILASYSSGLYLSTNSGTSFTAL